MDVGIHDGVPEADYFASPALSQSQAKTLLDCPARYRWERENPQPHRDAFDIGHAAHSLSLIHISEPTRPCGTSRMPSSA